MQFNSNSDFPGQNLPKEQWHTVARRPVHFEEAKFTPCACITTRILVNVNTALAAGLQNDIMTDAGLPQHLITMCGMNYLVQTARGVLVKTPGPTSMQEGQGGGGADWSDSSDEDSEIDDDEQDDRTNAAPQAAAGAQAAGAEQVHAERAYWLRRTLRSAIYGSVRFGVVLQKLSPPFRVILPGASSPEAVDVEWLATTEAVAIKEMSWDQIQTQRLRLAEDPIKEIAAMQHLERYLNDKTANRQQQEHMLQLQQQQLLQQQNLMNMNTQLNAMNLTQSGMLPLNGNNLGYSNDVSNPMNQNASNMIPAQHLRARTMLEAHVMTALDSLTDGRNLYSIMPYCSGGELFEVLEKRTKFSEQEARFWFHQILQGLTTLKAAGICHRDISLENLMIHSNNVLVIDMGMCLRIPFMEESGTKQRCLIKPQGTCGKWHCMSPEVCNSSTPFDGHAVDLWAAGVVLFIMLTGYPPWEKPLMSDERFKYMTNGYLVAMLTEWKTGLTGDAMDLLQRMFWLDPTDRLCLEQVWAHPWTQKRD